MTDKGPLFIQYCAKDFLDGVRFLTPWQELAYRRVCDLIYASGDRVANNDRQLATMTRTGTRWRKIKQLLIAEGKLFLTDDGRITNARCQREIAKILQKKREKTATFSSDKPLKNKQSHSLYARAKTLNQGTKETEPRSKPSESVAAREEISNFRNDLVVAPLPSEPPTPEEIIEVEALVERAVVTLRGDVPKGIRDPAAYQAAVTDSKFINLVRKLNAWVGTGLDGKAQWAAWEVLAAAEKAGARAGLTRGMRRNLNKIDNMYKASHDSERLDAAA